MARLPSLLLPWRNIVFCAALASATIMASGCAAASPSTVLAGGWGSYEGLAGSLHYDLPCAARWTKADDRWDGWPVQVESSVATYVGDGMTGGVIAGMSAARFSSALLPAMDEAELAVVRGALEGQSVEVVRLERGVTGGLSSYEVEYTWRGFLGSRTRGFARIVRGRQTLVVMKTAFADRPDNIASGHAMADRIRESFAMRDETRAPGVSAAPIPEQAFGRAVVQAWKLAGRP